MKPTDLNGAFFVSGPAGSGKTTLAATLREMGYNAIDEMSLGHFAGEQGQPIPSGDIHPEDEAWSQVHRWSLDEKRLRQILAEHLGDHLFVCGSSRNQYNFFPLFDKILFLDVNDRTLLERLGNERDHNYGKHPFQRRKVIDDLDHFRKVMKEHGATFIDAEQAPKAVAQTVLAAVQK